MLNIKQLNYSIDSLSKTKNKRLNYYRKKFIEQFAHLAFMSIDTIEKVQITRPDTLANDTITAKPFVYPLIGNFESAAQIQIVDMALKNARTIKGNIIFYKNELVNRQQTIVKHQVVWHQKFKLSLACLIFFFIGAPLGAIIRKGGLGLPVVISVVFFVLYHIVSMTGEKAVKTGEWDIVFGSWLSTALILPLGLFLTYKATTDAPLLDSESWKKYFDKFKFIKFKKG